MRLIFIGISIWLVFVLSLSTWWMIYGLRTLESLASGAVNLSYDMMLRQQKMLFYEGSVLALMQVLGAIFLFYFSYRMYKEKSAAENFFGSFTHDLKTSLFRVQLGVDQLCQAGVPNSQKLLRQTRDLQLHLENGLDSILGHRQSLVPETIELSDFVSELHGSWPGVGFQLKGKGSLFCDRSALKSIFENLIHNSWFHGKASEVFINVDPIACGHSKGWVQLTLTDNGSVNDPDWDWSRLDELGGEPRRSAKGSGYGLYLVCFWVKKMGGVIEFSQNERGFERPDHNKPQSVNTLKSVNTLNSEADRAHAVITDSYSPAIEKSERSVLKRGLQVKIKLPMGDPV